jgi:hypothetical protein
MSNAQRITELELRIEELEARVAGKPPVVIGADRASFDRAIRDLAKGNPKTLERYLQHGGKIKCWTGGEER